MASNSRLLIFNTASSYLKVGISFIVSLLLIPFILSKVGEEAFGLWSLIFSVLGFFGLMDLGFATAVVKYVAECKGAQALERRNQIVSTISIVYLAMAACAAGAVAVLAWGFSAWFGIPMAQQEPAVAVIWLLALRAVILNLPLSLFRGILFGEQRIYLINLISIGSTLLYAGLVWWSLDQGYGLVALAVSSLIAMLLEHLLYLIFSFVMVEGLRLSPRLVKFSILRELASFSGYQLVTDFSSLVLLQMDLLIVQWFIGLRAVAIYAVALRISTHVFFLVKQFVNVLSPVIATAKGEGREDRIAQLLLKGTRIAMVPGVLFFLCAWVLGERAIELWVGGEFAAAVPVLIVLMAAVLLGLPYLVAANVLAMTGHHRYTSLSAAASMVCNAVLSVLLVGPLGLYGVALATLLSRIGIDLLFVVTRACRQYQLGIGRYLLSAVLPSCLPGIFPYAILRAFNDLNPPSNLLWLFIDCALAGFVYLLIFWRYGLEEETKNLLRRA